jgi:hypothetical protein
MGDVFARERTKIKTLVDEVYQQLYSAGLQKRCQENFEKYDHFTKEGLKKIDALNNACYIGAQGNRGTQ